MKQIIMQACSLIVLCLINISAGCNPKVDRDSNSKSNGNSNINSYDNSNLIPYNNYERNRIETPNFEATIHGDNGKFGDLVDTEKPQKYWDINCETNCPYTGYDSGSGVVRGSSNNADLTLPQGEIHIQPYKQGPGYIQSLPSSGYNTGAGDNGRLINYKKITSYPSDTYSAAESYNGGSTGNTNNYYQLHYSGSDGSGEKGRFPNYDKVKPYKSGGNYKKESGVAGGLSWLDKILYSGTGKNGRYPSYNKGKPYTSGDYYERESNVAGSKTGSHPSYYELNDHEGDNGRWSTYNKGKQYQSDDYYTRVGPINNSFPELSAESSSEGSTDLNSWYQPGKKYKYTDLYHKFDELYKTHSGSKLQENPDVTKRPSIGGKVDSNKYDDLVGPVCSQCQSYQDSYPKSEGLLRQIYEFGVG